MNVVVMEFVPIMLNSGGKNYEVNSAVQKRDPLNSKIEKLMQYLKKN